MVGLFPGGFVLLFGFGFRFVMLLAGLLFVVVGLLFRWVRRLYCRLGFLVCLLRGRWAWFCCVGCFGGIASSGDFLGFVFLRFGIA